MNTPFDATSKSLVEIAPSDWLTFLGLPRLPEAVTAIDADLATVSMMADKVLRVADPEPWIVHLEFQAAWDGDLPRRMLAYNALLQQRHGMAVYSLVILLARAANATSLTGSLRTNPPLGAAWEFRYDVLRVWEVPPERFLSGPVGLIPFAPLGSVPSTGVPDVIEQVRGRLKAEQPSTAGVLWESMVNLLGLRIKEGNVADILPGLKLPKPTPELQKLIDDGKFYFLGLEARRQLNQAKVEEARLILIRQGTKKICPPTADQLAAIESTTDLDRLQLLLDRILDAGSWDELLRA